MNEWISDRPGSFYEVTYSLYIVTAPVLFPIISAGRDPTTANFKGGHGNMLPLSKSGLLLQSRCQCCRGWFRDDVRPTDRRPWSCYTRMETFWGCLGNPWCVLAPLCTKGENASPRCSLLPCPSSVSSLTPEAGPRLGISAALKGSRGVPLRVLMLFILTRTWPLVRSLS